MVLERVDSESQNCVLPMVYLPFGFFWVSQRAAAGPPSEGPILWIDFVPTRELFLLYVQYLLPPLYNLAPLFQK